MFTTFHMFSVLGFFAASVAPVFAAEHVAPQPASEADFVGPLDLPHHERPNDPYVPGYSAWLENSPPVYPLNRQRGNNYESVQVNVDFAGQNILGDAANEPSIAIDPNNPDRIVIGWRQFDTVNNDFRQAGRAYSHDGGLSWRFPGVLQAGEFASDPVVDSDSDGNFYYYSLQPDRGPLAWSCYMYKSTNGGISFGAGGLAAFGGDKAWFTVDKTGGVGDGNIYISWSPNVNANCCGANVFTRSVDGGLTYMQPIPVPLNPFAGTTTVGPDGSLYIVGGAGADGRVPVVRSDNARFPGSTPTFNVSTTAYIGGQTSFGGVNPDGLLGQMWIATDHSDGPTGGAVYVCGSVRPLDGSGDPLDIMFISSSNGGVDWSKPRRVNDDPRQNGAYQWFGTMSVAPTGRIDVVWNDTRADDTNNQSQLFYSYSFDGGREWSSNNPLDERQWDHHVGYPQQNKIGDYYHMISDEFSAHLAYAATYNGEQDVYYLRVFPLLNQCTRGAGGVDCNHNGWVDECDIEMGWSVDVNSNLIPDECETDFDGDGRHDGIDPDIDNDSVGNDDDICDYTTPRIPVTDDGRPFGDFLADCATDLTDFRFMDTCIPEGGPDTRHELRFCRNNFDGDGDEDVDLRDIARFQRAFTGFGN